MTKKYRGKDFLFSDDCGFINDVDGESYRYSDGSGYYYGNDGSEGYIYSDGSGYYHGVDGSDGYIYSDGSAYFRSPDGTDAYKYSDGSGYYHGSDGSEGYRYDDGSGYFKDPSGYQIFYDAEDEQDCDTENDEYSSALISFAEGFGNAIGTILGVCVAKILDNEQRKEVEREVEQKEREARKKAWRRQHRKGLIIVALTIALILTSIIGSYEYLIRIPVGYTDSEFIGKNYQDVIRKLKRSGFKYIIKEPVKDLSIDDIKKDNLVLDVKIGWKDSFKKNSKYPSNFPVKVKYHTLENLNVPISSKKAKKSDYKTVLKLFKEAGFINIKTKTKYDIITGWINSDGDIESVIINGDKKFDDNATYRADAKVIIIYHTLRKNRPK